MSDTNIVKEPSWKRFENHPGPSPEVEHAALQAWNIAKRSGSNSSNMQSGGRLMFGTPRKGKCRDLKVDGLRIK